MGMRKTISLILWTAVLIAICQSLTKEAARENEIWESSQKEYRKSDKNGDATELVARQGNTKQSIRGKAKKGPGILQECARICNGFDCTIYYCPNGVCCTPGSPQSDCCPTSKPVCLEDRYCCARGYTHVCGGRYCCTPEQKCCRNGYCCQNERSCCGSDSCCTRNSPCCEQASASQSTCCDKFTKVCCGSRFGCLRSCPSQFDAVACNQIPEASNIITNEIKKGNEIPTMKAEDNVAPGNQNDPVAGLAITCKSWDRSKPLYRILRDDENCNPGLLAKSPLATETIERHVGCGSRRGYVSQFISTSTTEAVSTYYNRQFFRNNGRYLRIAKIRKQDLPASCATFDLSTEAGRNALLVNDQSKIYASRSCEVLLSCTSTPVPCIIIYRPPRR